jgi:hypothetical protein
MKQLCSIFYSGFIEGFGPLVDPAQTIPRTNSTETLRDTSLGLLGITDNILAREVISRQDKLRS